MTTSVDRTVPEAAMQPQDVSVVEPSVGQVQHARRLFDGVRWSEGVGDEGESDFQLPVGTVTLLLADVEGSTRNWDEVPEAMAAAVQRLDQIVAETIGGHGGVRPLEQGEGDSFVAAFARAADAVGCALALQLAIVGDDQPDLPTLRLRVGVHTGDVRLRDGRNYIGATLNRCARLRDLGHGGQTLLSQATTDLVREALPAAAYVADLGTHRLRDLSRPERVFQLCHPALTTEFPPLRSLDRLPNNLPVSLTSFVGRAPELREVTDLLARTRLLTLTGAGGSGKTRLALQAAAEAADRHPGGVWFIDLAAARTDEEVPERLADTLSVRGHPRKSLLEAVSEHLAHDSNVLVVLDNCEHVVQGAAEAAERLLQLVPTLVVLATSREPLNVPGEVAWRVPSLTVPVEKALTTVEALGSCDAVKLFAERAAAVRPNFVLTPDALGSVAQICRRLDGIPLAIELAASRVRVMPVAQIADRLGDRFRFLGAGPRTAIPRQATLRASIDWSHELLSETEKVLFARSGVFVDGFDLDAVEAVCGFDPLSETAVLDLLDSLVQKSLIANQPDQGRYRLLETMRHYARERLEERGEHDLVADRHLAHYAAQLRWPANGPDRGWREQIAREGANARAALKRAATGGDAAAGLMMAAELTVGWVLEGRFAETVRILEELLARDGIPDAVRAWGLWAEGWNASFFGDAMTHAVRCAEALPMARASGNSELVAVCAATLAFSSSFFDGPAAVALVDEAIGLLDDTTRAFVRAHVEFLAATALTFAGNVERAATALDRSLGAGAPAHPLAPLLGTKGQILFARCELEACDAVTRDALAAARSERFPFWEVQCLDFIALAAALRDERDRAALAVEEAAGLASALDNGSSAFTGSVAAWVSLWGGDPAGALTTAERAIPVLRALNFRPGYLAAVSAASEAAQALGDVDRATSYRRELDAVEPAADRHYGAHLALYARCRATRAAGDIETAEDEAHAGLALAADTGQRLYALMLLSEVVAIAAQSGSPEEAARLAGGLDAVMAALRVRVLQDWRAPLEEVRTALGEERWQSLAAEGAALSLDELVAYARRGRGRRGRPSSGWRSLTPVELQVAALVKSGLSNREIGERLFVSTNTVRTHVSHIFTKLGLTSRSELASAATRRGL